MNSARVFISHASGTSASASASADDEYDEDDPLDSSDFELVDGEFVVEAFDNEEEVGKALCLEVEENAKAAIEERGGFTLAIPGGSVAKALSGLKDVKDLDWTKVHLFFVNERTPEGKCRKLAADTWTDAVGIPDANVHKVGAGTPAEEAKVR